VSRLASITKNKTLPSATNYLLRVPFVEKICEDSKRNVEHDKGNDRCPDGDTVDYAWVAEDTVKVDDVDRSDETGPETSDQVGAELASLRTRKFRLNNTTLHYNVAASSECLKRLAILNRPVNKNKDIN